MNSDGGLNQGEHQRIADDAWRAHLEVDRAQVRAAEEERTREEPAAAVGRRPGAGTGSNFAGGGLPGGTAAARGLR